MIAIETALRHAPHIDELWILPSSDRLDKQIGVSGDHRVAMLGIMLEEFFPTPEKPITISTLELDRPGLTTTHATLLELQQVYPDYTFHFLIGADLLRHIRNTWVNGKKLWDAAHFIALRDLGDDVPVELPTHIQMVSDDMAWVGVSSTFVRSLVSRGFPGTPYIHNRVAVYIKTHYLYGTKKGRV